ncbi:MAG: NAD(P)-dependent oxidoreductase [Bacteroidetes bacterium]|nr:NAD(P)-dependent oxidoreductase [Bacteroidota bacterium]
MEKTKMDMNLPGVLITGASGFVGRHFLEAANGKFRLFCLARRSQFEAGIPRLENQRWTQVDIAHRDALLDVARCVNDHGGADYVLHLAGYYDFTYDEHPEYERTNIGGTANVLELASVLNVKRFLYSSSLAACPFPKEGETINEDAEAIADFPYARSKYAAETLIREHEGDFARSILRLAAIYSDWCEYPPVYAFLNTWLSNDWNRNMLGGRGKSAVPYLHIRDLIAILLRVMERSDALPHMSMYNASPSHTTSHEDLFCSATRYLFGEACTPVHIPRLLALPAVAVRQFVLDLLGRPPFERTWMMRYIDRDLLVDASRTHRELDWTPTPRYDLKRRMLILIENMKSHPETWRLRNEAAFVHVARRPNFVMSNHLRVMRDDIIRDVVETIRVEQRKWDFQDYERMAESTLVAYVTLFFEVLVSAIRTRDRTPVRTYVRLLAYHRRRQGFAREHLCTAIDSFRQVMRDYLIRKNDPIISRAHIHDYLDLSLQLALEEIEETYAQLDTRDGEHLPSNEDVNLLSDNMEMIRMVNELHDICQDGWELGTIFRSAVKNGEE